MERDSKKAISWSKAKAGICVSLAVNFMICVYAPLEMFFNNQEDFWFDLYGFLPVLLAMFLKGTIVSLLVMCVMCFAGEKFYSVFLGVVSTVMLGTYVQGNFLVKNLPPLDGTSVNWSDYTHEKIYSLILWCLVGCVAIYIIKQKANDKICQILKIIGLCLIGILVSTSVIVCLTTKGYQKKGTLTATNKNLFEMSRDQNFIILVLDALDASTFSKIISQNSEYQDVFEDFVYFDNVVGAYPFTKHSIPFILSGDWYENDEPFGEYVSDAIYNSKILSELGSRSYKLGLYTNELNLSSSPNKEIFDNMVDNRVTYSSFKEFEKLSLQLSGIKFAPFDLKRFCYESPQKFNELRILKSEGGSPFEWYNKSFYDDLIQEPLALTNDKCFKFIHIEGGHVPFQYDKDLNLIENGTYQEKIESSLTVTRTYFDLLKRNGVFDNSVIVVMSDHGFDEVHGLGGRQNPILLVKGVNEKHALRTSNVPISYADLQDAYIKLLDGDQGDSIFATFEGQGRARRYLLYSYEEDTHMEEYIQTGAANDLTTMQPTGKVYDIDRQSISRGEDVCLKISEKSFSDIQPLDITFRVDNIECKDNNYMTFNGWGIADNLPDRETDVFALIISSDGDKQYYKIEKSMRDDIAKAFGDKYLLSGFIGKVAQGDFKADEEYRLQIGFLKEKTLYISKEYELFQISSQNNTQHKHYSPEE